MTNHCQLENTDACRAQVNPDAPASSSDPGVAGVIPRISNLNIRRKVDPKNEPQVNPGEMLEDYKFTQK